VLVNRVVLYLILSFLLLGSEAGYCHHNADQQQLTLSNDTQRFELAPFVEYLEDEHSRLTLSQVTSKQQNKFQHYASEVGTGNFGLKRGAFWHRFTLRNSVAHEIEVVLELYNPIVDNVELYIPENSNYSIKRAGTLPGNLEREIDSNYLAFSLVLQPHEQKTYFMKATSRSGAYFPLAVYTGYGYDWEILIRIVAGGIFVGMILGLLAYNSLIYLYTKIPIHLYYILLCLATALYCATRENYIYKFENFLLPINILNTIVPLIWSVAFSMFFRVYLATKVFFPILDRLVVLYCYFVAFCIVCAIAGLPPIIFIIFYVIPTFGYAIILFYVAIYSWLHGSRPALYMVIGLVLPIIAGGIRTLVYVGVVTISSSMEIFMNNLDVIQLVVLSLGLVSFVRVLTDEKLEKEKAAISASISNRMKSQFVNRMSFQIRNSLNGVISGSNAMALTALAAEQQRYSNVILRSGQSLLTIVNDIATFSQSEYAELTLESKPLNIAEHVKDCIGIFENIAQEKGLELLVNIDRNTPLRVMGDADRLRQILLNLLSNAFKFTERGQILLEVKCLDHSYEGSLGEYKFTVTDSGIGIDKEQQAKLFKAYQQADASIVKRFGGTGLGLVICQRLVKLMRGEMGFESEKGRGSMFWFTAKLPLCRTLEAQSELQNDESTADVLRGLRILIVDDDAICRQVLKTTFDILGAQSVTVSSGESALASYKKAANSFDLVLMDRVMPDMDGLLTTGAIREYERVNRLRAIPIIAVTAMVVNDEKSGCMAAGMNGFIAKPVTIDVLRSEIANVMLIKATV